MEIRAMWIQVLQKQMNSEFELFGTEMPLSMIILLLMMPILMMADSATENHTVKNSDTYFIS
jgi:hypothetical protein